MAPFGYRGLGTPQTGSPRRWEAFHRNFSFPTFSQRYSPECFGRIFSGNSLIDPQHLVAFGRWQSCSKPKSDWPADPLCYFQTTKMTFLAHYPILVGLMRIPANIITPHEISIMTFPATQIENYLSAITVTTSTHFMLFPLCNIDDYIVQPVLYRTLAIQAKLFQSHMIDVLIRFISISGHRSPDNISLVLRSDSGRGRRQTERFYLSHWGPRHNPKLTNPMQTQT